MKTQKKVKLILVLMIVFAASVTTGVYALLSSKTEASTNEFSGTSVNTAVIENGKEHEDYANNVEEYQELKKANDTTDKVVSILNKDTGNSGPVFVRVRLVASYRSINDTEAVHGTTPNITYNLETGTDWKVDSDHTFYYTKELTPNQTSDTLLKSVTLQEDVPEGYYVELKVLSDAIVTRPDTVLYEAWGIRNFSHLTPLTATMQAK